MISVIVPVYNAEPYLRKCLDSICGQTLRELDIVLVDDGSTDRSGEICDEYAAGDARVSCLHTPNGGISAARNRGIRKAAEYGNPYIAFVDSDDWLEPDMYRRLLLLAQETGADIAECGFVKEYDGVRDFRGPGDQAWIRDGAYNVPALRALLTGRLNEGVWNKIYRTGCFDTLLFPEGRVSEEIATTYLRLENAGTVAGTSWCGYHYRLREGSVDNTPSLRSMDDLWVANRDKYFHLRDTVAPEAGAEAGRELVSLQLKKTAGAILRNWAWRYRLPSGNGGQAGTVREMRDFSRKYIPAAGEKPWPAYLRAAIFLTRFDHPVSFFIAYSLNRFRRKISARRLYKA